MYNPPCQVCGTRHGHTDCPGDIRPTGPERHTWSIARVTRAGLEGCGVVLAPCRDKWRARIQTYPTPRWVPAECGDLTRFSGRFPEEAERQAVLVIRRTPPWSETPPAAHLAFEARTAHRHRKSLPIRFGAAQPTLFGTTLNLSSGGLFLATPTPMPAGSEVTLEVEVFGSIATLRGTVMWVRDRLQPARPRGMGVRLIEPPAVYAVYVHRLP